MATLNDLLCIDGVVIAGEFTIDGQLVAYQTKRDISPQTTAILAQFCATATRMFNTLADAHSHLTQVNHLPQHGWCYTGGDWTVAVGGNILVWVETDKADFNQLYKALHRNQFVGDYRRRRDSVRLTP